MPVIAHPARRSARRAGLALTAALALLAAPGVAQASGREDTRLGKIDHIVVIYQENHSFDNLYGGWEHVDGLAAADPAHTTQIDQAGNPYACLPQNDVNIAPACPPNAPFSIEQFIPPSATTCPRGVKAGTGLAGGCTRDLVHRFYQEQYQLNGGAQNRYTTGSDAMGLTQGVYDTRSLPIYRYLHEPSHPHYAISDRFFQAAFGGSFLNHQWLIAAATPTWPGGPVNRHSIVDSNGMPISYPLYKATGATADRVLTSLCPAVKPDLLCGDYAINTIQPPYEPHEPTVQLPPQSHPTIGDRLSAAGIDWAWYAGGWSNANGDVGAPGWTNGPSSCTDPDTDPDAEWPFCPNEFFQDHHQPFNYFANYAPGTAARAAHLRDEEEFLASARASDKDCGLKPVSFVKPIGLENEHPGYASEYHGSDHLVDLLRAVNESACRKDAMVIVTYDEFGGQWDHVPPPGQGATTPGPHDLHGPGTRIPALVIAPGLRGNFVLDHTSHDTTSVLATIERRFGLAPLTGRDAAVEDLSTAFAAAPAGAHAD